MGIDRSWDVLLIGGASGVGKTSLSYELARHFGIGISEVDDFHIVAMHISPPDRFPALHLFNRDPDAFFRMTEDEKCDHALACAAEMSEVLKPVIANHLESGPPLVLEGDFIHPELMMVPAFNRRVRCLVISEDEDHIAANYRSREGEDQDERAHHSWRYCERLETECDLLGVPTLSARPWETALARAIAILSDPNARAG